MDNQMGAFGVLPQQLILYVLTAVLASADKPADFYNTMLVSKGGPRMMKAMWSGHAHAAFALGVYNGSFLDFDDREPRVAAHLLALAASRGHMGALRDLAFCVTNCLGVPQDPAAGRRLTFRCNLEEFHARYPTVPELAAAYAHVLRSPGCLTNELGCFATVPASLQGWAHPANRFLCEWFAANPLPQFFPPARLPLLMCSFPTCGRAETRWLEYRRCHVCGIARYCSVNCESLHWRMGHMRECVPLHQWLMEDVDVDANAAAIAMPAVNNTTDHNNFGGGAAPAPM